MSPPIPSQLDGNQILQASFIETTGSLRTNATATIIGGDLTVETDHTHDSMALGDTVNLFTSTQVSSKNGLDVAIINTPTVNAVQSGNWDLRNITGTVSLPTGAATESTLSSLNTKIPSGLTVTSTRLLVDASGTIQPVSGTVTVNQGTSPWVTTATQAGSWTVGRTWTLSNTTDSVASVQSGTWNVNNITGTISLPTGASTSALQTSGNATLSSIDSKIPSGLTVTATRLLVDGSGTIQPVSGTVAVSNFPATQAVTQSTSPWVISGSTGRTWTLASGTDSVTSIQGTSPWVVSGTVNAAQSGTWTTGRTWTLLSTSDSIASVQSGAWNITNITGTISLPTGASTSALQTTGNSSLSSIDSKTPALGQAVMASSMPVVIASNQSTIPISGSVSVSNFPATQPVSGTVSVTQSTSPWVTSRNWTLASGTDSISSVQSGTWSVTANAGTNLNTSALALDTTVAALQVSQASTTSGQKGSLQLGAVTTAAPAYTTAQTSPLSLTTSGALRTDSSGSTQPVSGTVAATQSGTWNIGTLTTITNPVAVTQSTSPWVVSGTVTANAGTNLNTSALALDTSVNGLLRAQASTTSGQTGPIIQGAVTTASPTYTTGQTNPLSLTTSGALRVDTSGTTASQNITQFGGTNLSTGTGASGAGIPRVTVANDSNILATQSGTWNITNISGTVSLPTGASTSALQTTGNTSLTSIQTTSNSTAVNTSTIAANQTNGNQRTLVSDLVGNLLPSGDAAARSIFMRISDGTNNVLTTTINSRVRLDVNVASEGVDGSAVPFQTTQVGGRDGSGNLQTIATDTSGNQFISSRIPLTASAPTFATIGVTSGTVIAANTNRKGLVIQNTSSLASISLNLVGGSAVLNSGITLYPHDIFYMDEFTFTTSQIDAISSLASTNVSVQELA